MALEILLVVVIVAAILQFFDASAGMGFGEITAALIVLGFHPIEVVPAVILSSAILSITAGVMHQGFKNFNLFDKKTFRITALLTGFGILGIITGSFVAVNISEIYLTAFIAIIIIGVGILTLLDLSIRAGFSWKRLIGFGTVASFNKGMTGGGYGPVLANGQILSGIQSKRAVAITATSEGIVSAIGFLTYFLLGTQINISLIGALVLGGLIGTPIAVFLVKKVKASHLRYAVGGISIMLGLFLLGRFIFHLF